MLFVRSMTILKVTDEIVTCAPTLSQVF
jgi:hypothetical protein